MKRKELQKIVEDRAHQAADIGAQALNATVTKLSPFVEEAGEKVGPLAHDAKVKSAAVAVAALEALQPHIEDALGKIAPAVEVARERVVDDFMPKVTGALHDAAEHPAAKEAAGRVTAAAAALAGKDVAVTEKKKGKAGKTLLVVSLVAAALGGALVLIKKLTGSKSGWEAHTPSPAYTPPKFSNEAASADMTSEGAPEPVATQTAEPGATQTVAADAAAAVDVPADTLDAESGAEVSVDTALDEAAAAVDVPADTPDTEAAGDVPAAAEEGDAPFRA